MRRCSLSGCPRRALSVVADAGRERERRAQRRRGAAVRAEHRHRRDGLVRLAVARRPRRRRPARDRRAVLLDVRLRRRAVCWARAPRRRAGSTPRASSPTSTATACARSSSAATRGRSRRTSSRGGRLQLEPGWPASTCSGGQCPETRGMAAADLDGDGRIEVGRDDDEHLADRVAGVRLRRSGADAGAAGWPRYNACRRARLQRRRQPRLRRVRRERRDRQPRRRPAARDRRHVRQPPDQRLQPRRDVGARVALVHEPRERPRRARASAGGSSSAG